MGGEVHLLDRLTPIYRHRRLVVSVFVLAVALIMLKSYSTTPRYMARARLLMDEGRGNMAAGFNAGNPGFWIDPPRYYRTQMFIIGGRGLAQRTIRQLDLDTVAGIQRRSRRPGRTSGGDQFGAGRRVRGRARLDPPAGGGAAT